MVKLIKALKIICIVVIVFVLFSLCFILSNNTEDNFYIEFYDGDVLINTFVGFSAYNQKISDLVAIQLLKDGTIFNGWFFDPGVWKKEFQSLDDIKNFSYYRRAVIKVYAQRLII